VLTRGDARQRNDAPVPRRDVFAHAVAVRRQTTVTTLVVTLRFGVAPLVRFLLRESYRRVRLVRAMLRRTKGGNLTRIG